MSLFRGALKAVLLVLTSLGLVITGLSGSAVADQGSRYLNVLVTADNEPLGDVEVAILRWDDTADEWIDTGDTVPEAGEGFYTTEVVGEGRYTVRLHDPEGRWPDDFGVGTSALTTLQTAEGTFAVTSEYTRNAMIAAAFSGEPWTAEYTSGHPGHGAGRLR